MPDDTGEEVTADDIRQAVYRDAADGIASFSDGTHSVQMMDLEKRLAIADQVQEDDAASTPAFGLRHTRLKSPGGWS